MTKPSLHLLLRHFYWMCFIRIMMQPIVLQEIDDPTMIQQTSAMCATQRDTKAALQDGIRVAMWKGSCE